MRAESVLLCIGGPADGRLLPLDDTCLKLQVSVPGGWFIYARRCVGDAYVLASEEMSDEELLLRLKSTPGASKLQ
ncbi:hypothetical protein MPL3356_60514 [Mesorhizobium plurifarium]|uniref:Uncharacterized protein n=1 Tax=Mesorhizobium plurifarium TaxID=69974 RepID=A0A090G6U6_MESPL|nr:hypothetical protein MPL3356_60514 [Mesorhizobium plurifarium]